jgi:hypothetical protein
MRALAFYKYIYIFIMCVCVCNKTVALVKNVRVFMYYVFAFFLYREFYPF